MEALTESFVFYPVERFDIAGKQLLKANRKFYLVDLGIRSHILPRRSYDLGFSIENVVYFELLRRGYKVAVGKLGATEVDFVAQKQGAYTYYQVTASMMAEETFDRELRPLRAIKDNYEKVVLTLDRLTVGNYDGIRVVNLLDWLTED
jgi:predicted AAA+ superfamily ATPase